MSRFFLACFLAAASIYAQSEADWLPDGGPDLLSYDEVVELAGDSPNEAVSRKLDALLASPTINNAAARTNSAPKKPVVAGVGPVMRIALWNLERGYNLSQIELALDQPSELLKLARSPEAAAAPRWQAEHLSGADVIVINEADLGVSRSDYADVTAHLATRLRMNYAFGVEFVEVDPILLGLEQPRGDAYAVRDWTEEHRINRDSYRGLHGNAVLSRYPIIGARVIRLPECYDWFGKEKRSVAQLEKGKRWTARRVFEERISREIRRGGRIALVVELAVSEAPGGRVTVVSTHLENKCRPACRQDQMDAVMASLKEVSHAVVVAGDMNTTGTNAAPTSIRREITRRASSLKFWLGMALRYMSPVALPQIGFVPANHFKNYLDPSAFHLPLLLPNREDGLFTKVQRFRFSDGGKFDFGGSPSRTRDGRAGTLANSNERSLKGYQPTFAFERTFGGIVGRYKLDWLFVKPAGDGTLAPHHPATMNDLNEVTGSRISDHPPLTVDLPLRMSGSGL